MVNARQLLQRLWQSPLARLVVVTVIAIAILLMIDMGDECLYYLNGTEIVGSRVLAIMLWCGLMFFFVLRRWWRLLLIVPVIAAMLIAPTCILRGPPGAPALSYSYAMANAARAARKESEYPLRAPQTEFAAPAKWDFRYLSYPSRPGGPRDHFRVEAVRQHGFCRALPNITMTDDGTTYFTNMQRPADSSNAAYTDKLPFE